MKRLFSTVTRQFPITVTNNAWNKMTEILKQKQNSPLPLENQVAILYALVNGLIDDVDTTKVEEFETKFHEYMNSNQKELLNSIAAEKDISENIKTGLDSAIGEFKSTVSI